MDLRKKIIAIIIIGLFIGLAILPANSSEFSQMKLKRKNILYNSEMYYEADSDFEYGKNIGRRYYLAFNVLSKLAFRLLKKEEQRIFLNNAEHQKKQLEKYCPMFLDELKGLAASTNIKIERLIVLQLYIASLSNECTITASTGPATKGNQTFLTQNFDMSIFSPQVLIFRLFFTKKYHIHHISNNYRYVYIGIPILYEYPLLNEKGVGFGGTFTSITDNESRTVDEGEGINPYFIVRASMRSCANVQEIGEFWRNSERASSKDKKNALDWDYDTYVFCDREDGIVMIEQSHSYIITVFGNSTDITNEPEGILWHANHHQWLDPYLTGSKIVGEDHKTNGSGIRAERALELLKSSYGNITINECMNLTRDHAGGFDPNNPDSADICRHPDKDITITTVTSWIVQPKEYMVYWTRGQPCKRNFKAYDFTWLFG